MDDNSIEFLAFIAPSMSAVKISGNGNGGTLLLAFDDTQLPEAMKAVLLREQLLRVRIGVEEE